MNNITFRVRAHFLGDSGKWWPQNITLQTITNIPNIYALSRDKSILNMITQALLDYKLINVPHISIQFGPKVYHNRTFFDWTGTELVLQRPMRLIL